jgi:phospholipase/lecithinase/hemolysin
MVRPRRNSVFPVALLVALAVAWLPLRAGAAFDRLYVFGDSLSDVGNVQAVTSGLAPLVEPTPGPCDFNGRTRRG